MVFTEKQVCVHMLLGSAPQLLLQLQDRLLCNKSKNDHNLESQESEAAAILAEFQRFFESPHIRKVWHNTELKP